MSAEDSTGDNAPSLHRAEWVDAVCDRFEAALRAGEHPVVEEYLADTTEPARSSLKRELQAIERDYVLRVRCPHCQHPIGGESERSTQDIICPSCKCRFRFVGDDSPSRSFFGEQRRIAHYEMIRLLGSGRFGDVWLARDTRLERQVAIKIPRKGELSQEEARRFEREAQAASQLEHPNIVQVYEVGREQGLFYLVCEYIAGRTLSDWLEVEHLSPREAAELCAKIAEALHVAHQQGIVHRDIKPSNILLDDNGEPHIADFGLARRDATDVTVTLEGQVFGTPAYMSPEQARGEGLRADPRSDIYSIGAMLYHLLTGTLPFQGSIRMTVRQVLQEDPRRPRSLNDHIPRDLETICLKAMEKEPSWRYHSAHELAQDLRRFLHDQPVVARPKSRLQRVWLWARRPARIREAGMVLQAMTALKMAFGVIGVVVFSVGTAVRPPDYVVATKLLIFVGAVYVPLYLVGYWTTVRRSIFAIWIGFLLQVLDLSLSLRPLITGQYAEYEGLTGIPNPEARLRHCIAFAAMAGITCVYYMFAVIAYYSNRMTLRADAALR